MINHFQQLITNTLGKIHLKIFCPFWFIYNRDNGFDNVENHLSIVS